MVLGTKSQEPVGRLAVLRGMRVVEGKWLHSEHVLEAEPVAGF